MGGCPGDQIEDIEGGLRRVRQRFGHHGRLAFLAKPCFFDHRGQDQGPLVWGYLVAGHFPVPLHDSVDDPRYIQTLPGRGYRLILPPRPLEKHSSSIVIGAGNGTKVGEIGLLENLQQRGVLEAGLAYLIIGWLLIQIADVIFNQLLLPQWAGTFVTILVIAGFPIVLFLSWLLEFRDGRCW